jgi:TIR domain
MVKLSVLYHSLLTRFVPPKEAPKGYSRNCLKSDMKAMSKTFAYDVFLSHTSKDKPAVRELAEHLKQDGLRVWFDEWIIQPGDLVSLKIEQGLEQSRTLILVMSHNAFGIPVGHTRTPHGTVP